MSNKQETGWREVIAKIRYRESAGPATDAGILSLVLLLISKSDFYHALELEMFTALPTLLNAELAAFNFTKGTLDALSCAGYRYVGELARKTPDDLRKLPNIGPVRAKEIGRILELCGIQPSFYLSWQAPDKKTPHARMRHTPQA